MGWQSAPMIQRGPVAKAKGGGWQDAPAVTGPVSGKKRASEPLGMLEGVLPVVEKLNDYSPANIIPGFHEKSKAGIEGMHRRIDELRQTRKPGLLSKTLANIELTAPAVLMTKDPLLVGGIQGGLTSEHKDAAGIAGDAAFGAILNKAAGAATAKVGEALAPVVAPAVRKLQQMGVRLTPGQVKGGKAMAREDKAMSRPGVGDKIAEDRRGGIMDFNRARVNEALFPLGVRLPGHIQTGHDAVAFMQDEAGKAYDRIMPNLSLRPDPRMAVGFRKAADVLKTLPDREADIFRKVVANRLDFDAGHMAGRPLTAALRDIRNQAAGYSRSASEAERQLGEALSHVDDGIHSALTAQNPGYAKALTAANKGYKGSRIVSDAAKGADEGIATTGQHKAAVRQNDRTKNQRATGAGRAFMQDTAEAGRAVLPAKIPDSGTAGRQADGKLIERAKGAVEGLLYDADKALTGMRLAPRPEVLKKVAGLLERHKAAISAGGGPVLGGLLAGLFPNE